MKNNYSGGGNSKTIFRNILLLSFCISIVKCNFTTTAPVCSVSICDSVYFGEEISEIYRQFYYYKIDFNYFEHYLSLKLENTNEKKEELEQIVTDFKNIFINRPTNNFYPTKTPHQPYSYFTAYSISSKNLPLLQPFSYMKNYTNLTTDTLRNVTMTIKNIISTTTPLLSTNIPLLLPSSLKIPNNVMPWPLWINNMQISSNFYIRYQLYKYTPFLLPLLMPLPLSNPPPYNSFFIKNENNHYMVHTENRKNLMILSTIIDSFHNEQECSYTSYINSGVCVVSFPKREIIKLIFKNEKKPLNNDVIVEINLRIHKWIKEKYDSVNIMLECIEQNLSEKWCLTNMNEKDFITALNTSIISNKNVSNIYSDHISQVQIYYYIGSVLKLQNYKSLNNSQISKIVMPPNNSQTYIESKNKLPYAFVCDNNINNNDNCWVLLFIIILIICILCIGVYCFCICKFCIEKIRKKKEFIYYTTENTT